MHILKTHTIDMDASMLNAYAETDENVVCICFYEGDDMIRVTITPEKAEYLTKQLAYVASQLSK